MFVVALLFFVVNTVLGIAVAIMARQFIRREPERIFSETAEVIWLAGIGAYFWQFCAILESIVFLFVPYPSRLAATLVVLEISCLLVVALSLWIVFRARPSWTLYAELGALKIALGTIYTSDHPPVSAGAPWLSRLLMCVFFVVIIEVGAFVLIDNQRRLKEAKNKVAAQRVRG